ncbi:hypothetical protein EGW08_018200 [Elysia chlorotica]|uniref:Ig-like domain-containing protein n=1 Tax=Elysia chlorotica TaxID=188477 RepID=A0A433SXQ7_ELYCH|nr:hypothetical protein EGW08_018200 [Elysia chlorotica]
MLHLTGIICVLWLIPLVSLSKLSGFKSTPGEVLGLHMDHPEFRPTPRLYTVTAGQTAELQCAVVNVEEVIWKRDSRPLTVGLESFYNTDRFSVVHPSPHQWNLLIRNASRNDSGFYECEISSTRKYLRKIFQLNVIEVTFDTTHMPRKDITVTGTEYVDMGDHINLICNATGRNHSPSAIDWFLNGNKLTSRGTKVEIKENVEVTKRTIVSFLHVADAQLSDGGNYVCRTTDLLIKSFTVTVLNSNKSNSKRGTIAEQDSNLAHEQEDTGRQGGLLSDVKNSAHARDALTSRHIALYLVTVLALLRHALAPR